MLGDRIADTTLADAKGRFYFRNVPLGEIVVTAEKVGYFNGGYGQRRASGMPLPFSLPFGQAIPNMRIELYRGGVITGSILDAAGEPAVGIRVVALRRQFLGGEWKYGAADGADTDDRGVYRIFGLMPGEYLITVPSADITVPAGRSPPVPTPLDEDSPASTFPTMFYAGTEQRLLSQSIVLRSGDVRYAADFTLPLIRTHRVVGRLTGESSAVANQRIRIVPLDAGWESPDAIAETESTENGAFAFDRLPRGQYQLLAGNVDASIRNATPPISTAEGVPVEPVQFCARVGLVVQDEDLDMGGIEMQATPRLTGDILFERVMAGPDTPLPPSRVAIVIEPAESGLSRSATLYATGNRPFTISNLIPGDYFIRVDSLPRGWFVKSITSGSTDGLNAPITIAGDEMHATITLTTRGTEVIGTVRDSRMQLAAGAAIIIVPAVPASGPAWLPSRTRETRASSSGVFTVRGLPPGEYLVLAIDDAAAEGWQDPRRLAALRPQATRFRLKDAETVSLVLTIR
jgi:hypothetical protein